jgi:hypothetical protein
MTSTGPVRQDEMDGHVGTPSPAEADPDPSGSCRVRPMFEDQ